MKRATHTTGFTIALALMTFCLCASMAWAAPQPYGPGDNAPKDSFLASDDYSDSDTIKGTFLNDAQYAKMTKDFKRNGAEFDWGWATPDINVHAYKTAHVTLKDDYGVLQPEFNKAIKTTFEAVAKQLGWTVVGSGSKADVELGLDIVGYDADSHFAWVTTIQPSVELEIRLRDKSGKDLYLIRNREHSSTPAAAAREMAHDMIKQLR